MNQWLNRSHPPTLQAAVFLGYLTAFLQLLGGRLGALFIPPGIVILLLIALGAGAFVTANNRRWGYALLAASASALALLFVARLVDSTLDGFGTTQLAILLAHLNAAVFPVALAAAVLHSQSREYQQIWFE